jgi:hypothetical protein
MSGPRRDSNDGTRGNNLHGRGHKSTDDNKKAGGGHGKHQLDDNARPPNQ